MDLVKLIFDQIKDRSEISEGQFRALTSDWSFAPVGHQPMGAIMHKDGHIHVAILPEFRNRWASRALINQTMKRIAVDGKVYTTSIPGDSQRQRFIERIGFKKTSDIPLCIYEMTV